MKYRVSVVVGVGRLGAVIEAACKDNPDPDLRVEPVESLPALPAPRRAKPQASQPPKAPRQTRLTPNGIKRQEVVEAQLKTGPKRWSQLRTAIGEAGLPQGTLNSLVSKWQTEGKIQRGPDGLWSLTDAGRGRVSEEAATAHG